MKRLGDDELLRRLSDLLLRSRRIEADLVAHIGEVDTRRLYAREAFPSMFAYATQELHLSEGEAYTRIAVARAARQHPVLLTMLRDGRLHLSGIVKLLPHLTRVNLESLLARAVHKTKRQIEELVAEVAPKPDAPATMRRLPRASGPTTPSPSPAATQPRTTTRRFSTGDEGEDGRAVSEHCGVVEPPKPGAVPSLQGYQPAAPSASSVTVEPLAPRRYKVQFTATAELHAKLERLQALMRAAVPDGDLATIIEQAVTEKVDRLEARRFGRTRTPRKGLEETDTSALSRYVPAPVRRAVYERDGGRCCYVDHQGRRCPERHNLEFHHHEKAFGRGGDHNPKGLRCTR